MPDIPAVHCEVKLHGFRRTADGVVVSFVVHPSEVPRELALDPLGTRYMLALAAIGDDEQPIEPPSPPLAERPGVETGISPTARARASEMGKEHYANAPPMLQACTRAALLAKDERFQAWAEDQRYPGGVNIGLSEDGAAQFIREHCCEGATRAEIAVDPEAYRKFLALERLFHEAIGVIPEMRS